MALLYRHKPITPALVSAMLVLTLGCSTAVFIRNRVLDGEADIQSYLFAVMMTVVLSGCLIIVAFARYRFVHLWKSTGARHSDKYKQVEKMLRKRCK